VCLQKARKTKTKVSPEEKVDDTVVDTKPQIVIEIPDDMDLDTAKAKLTAVIEAAEAARKAKRPKRDASAKTVAA